MLRLSRDVLHGGDARTTALLRLHRPAGLFQPHGTTHEDRYPEVFTFVRALVGDGVDRSILSYGCATGEEVAALRGHFPTARIKGIDISAARVATARANLPIDRRATTEFAVAGSAAGEPPDFYDAVFAMAVFRHGDLMDCRSDCSAILTFARFEAAMQELAARVRPGGCLVLYHANFRFADTSAAAAFGPVLALPNISPLYGPDNRLLPRPTMIDGVFRKRTS